MRCSAYGMGCLKPWKRIPSCKFLTSPLLFSALGKRQLSSFSDARRKLKTIWSKYISFLDSHSWKAQCINTSILVGLGDVLSQTIALERTDATSFNFIEGLRYFAVGLVILGPSMHVWYHGLDKIIKTTGLQAAIKKTLMDQLLFLPIYVAGIIAIMGFLTGEIKEKIYADLSRDFVPIMTYCYMGWPWIQILNFHYVPLKHRIFVMNFVGLFYNTLIAWKVEKNRHEEAKHKLQ